MKLTRRGWLRLLARVAGCAATIWLAGMAAQAQAVSTTAVQGTVYLANGQPAGGTLVVSWPTFTTAAGQLISAGQTTVTVGTDGFVSVNLAPNQGATPAGEYYTAVFYKSDGTVSTQYWLVPAAAQASLAQVQAQVMPAAQAVQAVSKAYVDQTVAQALGSQLLSSGGNLTGPLYLNGDPTQPLQAADKHYVDSSFSAALPLSGGTITGPASFSAAVTFGSSVTASSGIGFTGTGAAQTLANLLPGAASDGANGLQVAGKVSTSAYNNVVEADQQSGADACAKIQTAENNLPSTGGSIDARGFQGTQACSGGITISKPTVLHIAPGATFQLSSPLYVNNSAVSIRGGGMEVYQSAQGNGTIFKASSTFSGTAVIVISNNSVAGTNLSDFMVDCNSKATNGLEVTGGSNGSFLSHIYRIAAQHCVDGLYAVGSDTYNWEVFSSYFLYNTNGIVLGTNSWDFFGDHVDNNADYGYVIDNSARIGIQGGDVEGNGSGNIDVAPSTGDVRALGINSVYFEPTGSPSGSWRDINFACSNSHYIQGADVSAIYANGGSAVTYSIELPSSLCVKGLHLHGSSFLGYTTADVHNQGGAYGTTSGNYSGDPALLSATTGFDEVEPQNDGVNFSQSMMLDASIPKVSPVEDIRAYGAKIDGSTDIGTALNSAIAACNSANGDACTVLLPCAGPNGCYLANGAGIAYTGTQNLQISLQGTLNLGSTLVVPNSSILQGSAGGIKAQFQSAGAVANIVAPAVYGTMGTAITTTGNSVTFTPTFAGGSITNFHVGVDITVAGTMTCTGMAASRTANGSPSPNVTFTGGSCTNSSGTAETIRIPVFETITVSGCSDSTFDGSGLTVNGQDWPNGSINVFENASTSTATGCTVTGFDDNSFETAQITAVSGNNLTATFAHPHAASDSWGMVGVTVNPNNFSGRDLTNLAITGSYGMGLYIDDASNVNLNSVSIMPGSYLAAGTMECDGCWWQQWNNLVLQRFFSFKCTVNCSQPSYSYALRCSQDVARNNGMGCYSTTIISPTILGGIKIDGNGQDAVGGAGTDIGPIIAPIFEEISAASVMVDSRHGFAGGITLTENFPLISDNFIGDNQYFVGGTDCCVTGTANLGDLRSGHGGVMANKYWPNVPGQMASVRASSMTNISGVGAIANPGSYGYSTGLLTDGQTIDANVLAVGSGFGPRIVPTATLAMSPVSSVTCATCTFVTGPDGVANGAVQVEGNGSSVEIGFGTPTITTYAGDYILFGGWAAPGTNNLGNTLGSQTGTNRLFNLYDPSDTLSTTWGGVALNMTNNGWEPGYAFASVITGDSSPHTLDFGGVSPSSSGVGTQFACWFAIEVPGPNNPAYAGASQAEMVRWAQDVLKGCVPSGAKTGLLYGGYPLVLQVATKVISGTSGSGSCTQSFQGTAKQATCYLNGYAQTGTAQTYTFPTAFSTTPVLLESGGSCGTYNPTATATTLTLPANASMTAETCNVVVMGQ